MDIVIFISSQRHRKVHGLLWPISDERAIASSIDLACQTNRTGDSQWTRREPVTVIESDSRFPRVRGVFRTLSLEFWIEFRRRFHRIRNPLTNRTPDELDQDVEKFHERQELGNTVDLSTLVKGARIARDPRNLSEHAVPGITPAERSAIERERESNFFQQSKPLKVTILTTACAAVIQ